MEFREPKTTNRSIQGRTENMGRRTTTLTTGMEPTTVLEKTRPGELRTMKSGGTERMESREPRTTNRSIQGRTENMGHRMTTLTTGMGPTTVLGKTRPGELRTMRNGRTEKTESQVLEMTKKLSLGRKMVPRQERAEKTEEIHRREMAITLAIIQVRRSRQMAVAAP